MSRYIKIASLLCLLFLVELAPIRQCYAQTTDPPKPPIYVGAFDIDVVPAKNERNGAGNTKPSVDQRGQKKEETAAQHARRLVDLLSNDLLEALWKAGYSAQRLGPDQERPSGGVQIRGVFAEVDNENHWRRAVIRSGSDSGKVQVLVSVANLARPEQALYEIAHLPGNENKPGAVITLSPYVPVTKFETDKDPEENQFKRIASRVVTDLTALLNANPAALTE